MTCTARIEAQSSGNSLRFSGFFLPAVVFLAISALGMVVFMISYREAHVPRTSIQLTPAQAASINFYPRQADEDRLSQDLGVKDLHVRPVPAGVDSEGRALFRVEADAVQE